ncbi:MAG TPA: TolC family protein [Verrucomicrobiae bacterium]|nr:TolC family protein [Verrucomicrobiae bacterium]
MYRPRTARGIFCGILHQWELATEASSLRGNSRNRKASAKILCWAAIFLAGMGWASRAAGQTAPAAADQPWHAPIERGIEQDAKQFHDYRFTVDPAKTYALAELIDLAESHNPETRVAWERARAQAAALGITRSELYPTLAAAALSQTSRDEVYFGTRFYRVTTQDFRAALDLNYTIFDFGARSGSINAARAQVLAANFAFNDTHRNLIYRVEEAYYRLLNTIGQEEAARASLKNAQTVQQSSEDRLAHGLATLPDVLEARSATAQAEYDLQTVLGEEEVARGDLATALGSAPTSVIHVQPLEEVPTPDGVADTVNEAIDRALGQRPDLMQQVAEIRSANAEVKSARAAYYPVLSLNVAPSADSLFGMQQALPWGYTADLTGSASLSLTWTVFDGGARKNRVAQAEANLRTAQAQTQVTRDEIENEVWAAYSNLTTAFRQREAATALLESASKSYEAALQSYNYGLRNLLDVTAAQQTLARARSADVLARTQVLTALANLAFRTGDSIQEGATKTAP